MQITVKGRHMDVAPAVRDYAVEKVGRVVKISNNMLMSAEVELYTERNRSIEKTQVAEVTVQTKGHVIRARESAHDMYAAIDLMSEKLESQVRRFKEKLVDRRTKGEPMSVVSAMPDQSSEPSIVKTKRLATKPMSTDEAILQMELLGHDFFVFRADDMEGTSVLYRRKDGDYGLITSS